MFRLLEAEILMAENAGKGGMEKTFKFSKKIVDNFKVLIYNMSCVTKTESRFPKNSDRGVAQFG